MQQHSLGIQATRIYRYVSFTCGRDFKARCATITAEGIISETVEKIENLFVLISAFDFHSLMWSFMILDTVSIYQHFKDAVRRCKYIFLAWSGMMDAVIAQWGDVSERAIWWRLRALADGLYSTLDG